MKRKILLYILLLAFCNTLEAQEPAWGTPDTLEHYSLGAGVQYTKIAYRDKPILMWVTTIDLTNPYTKIEQIQSNNKVPDVPRETVMSMSKAHTYPGHRVCAAFNHDFFVYEAGVCIGVNVSNGEIPYGAGWGRSIFAVSEDETAAVFYPSLNANVILKDGSTVKIDYYNSAVTFISGNCVLFNHLNSRTLTEQGKYIKIKPLSRWKVKGDDIKCEVLEISDVPLQTSQTECVIYARNESIQSFEGKVTPGDIIFISQKFVKGKFGEPLKNIVAGFHGYPSIAYEGKLHEGEYNDFENGREYEVSARVMGGMSKDGKTVYIVTVEGGTSASPGVNCIDIANWMLAHGSWNVVNFDSGGSATIAVDHEMLNYPMRGSIRPVADALLVVSTAPEEEVVASYAFITPSLYTTAVSLNPLTLLSFNEHGKMLEKGVQGFTYQCIPEDLGYVDSEGVFHASLNATKGQIIATKDGKKAVLNVFVSPVSDVQAYPQNILIDGIREFPIRIDAKSGKQVYQLDPGAFTWSSSNPDCCLVQDGVIKGIANGETGLHGTLDELSVHVNVKVEIAGKERIHETFADLASWPIKTSGTFSNLRYENTALPNGWEDGINMIFDVKTRRSASIEFNKPVTFYSLPDSVSFRMFVKDDVIKELYLDFASNTKTGFLKTKLIPVVRKDSTYYVSFMDGNIPLDLIEYPLALTSMKFYLKPGLTLSDTKISFKDLKAYYPSSSEVGISGTTVDKSFSKLLNWGDEAVLHYSLSKVGTASIALWTVDGKNIMNYLTNRQLAGEYTYNIPLYSLNDGIYCLSVTIDGRGEVHKFIVKK